MVIKNFNEPYVYLNNIIKNKLINMYNLKPIVSKAIPLNKEEIILDDLKKEIVKLLDDYIKKNNLKLSRRELLEKLNLENENRLELWNYIKKITNWKDSKTPIAYKNKLLFITY